MDDVLNDEDARDVINFLEHMFRINDLEEIHTNAITRVTRILQIESNEDYSQNEIHVPMVFFLNKYLLESIKILKSRSSFNYDDIMKQLNNNIQCENSKPILGIKLHLSPIEAQLTGMKEINLRESPDYSPLIYGFRDILDEYTFRG